MGMLFLVYVAVGSQTFTVGARRCNIVDILRRASPLASAVSFSTATAYQMNISGNRTGKHATVTSALLSHIAIAVLHGMSH
jgi:hypothetical protein